MAQPSVLTRARIKKLNEETDQVETEEDIFEEAESDKFEINTIRMDFVKPVNNLSLEGNVSENWKKFIQNFEIFLEAADLSNKPDARKVAVLLNAVGEEGLELF